MVDFYYDSILGRNPNKGRGELCPRVALCAIGTGLGGATRCGLGGAQGEVSEDLCEPNEPEVHQQLISSNLSFSRKLINESNTIL